MTTTTERRYSEHQARLYRGVPSDVETLNSKMDLLHDQLLVARDYKVGDGLIELAHDRIDEAMTIIAGALAPWDTAIEEDADKIEEDTE